MQFWTSEGWIHLKRSVRHETEKKIYKIRANYCNVVVTEHHSLLDKNRGTFKPCDLVLAEELLQDHLHFCERKLAFAELLIKVIL